MKKLLTTILLLITTNLVFADSKITELSELTAPTTSDLLVVVDDVAGTPTTKKLLIDNLLNINAVIDHINILSTGTNTHAQIDTQLSLLATSTTTLQVSITNLETSTSTLEGYIFDLWASTSTLEGYIFDLWVDTASLRTDVDALIVSTGTFLTKSSATATYLQLSSATATYLQLSSATANYLNRNGTVELTGNWDAGSFVITALNFISDVATGTQPYATDSITLNTNLNADLLDGVHASTFTPRSFVNGSFVESFNALVTVSAEQAILSVEQSGGGDLTMQFSDGLTTFDTTPSSTVVLTHGLDSSPQGNYVCITSDTKKMVVSTTEFPTTEEHIKIAYLLLASTSYIDSDGAYINQNWNDHLAGTDNMGHMLHIAERSRRDGAYYFSGLDPDGTDQDTNSSYFDYVSGTESYFKSTTGIIYQMHRHTISAKDTRSDDVHVVNWNGDAYHDIHDLADIVADSAGASLSNKYFNVFFFAVGNKSGEYAPIMCQLPSGSYVSQTSAENDVDKFNNEVMPREFSLESSVGVPICRMTLRWTGGLATLSHISTADLREAGGGGGGGGSAGGANFADNQFTVFDEADVTKIMAFDVGTNVTTANTRTLQTPDASGVIALTAETDGTIEHIAIKSTGTNTHAILDTELSALATTYIKQDGTTPLTSDWDAGSFKITAEQFESDVAFGTPPFIAASSTVVTNLNADLLDGLHVGISGNVIPALDGSNVWSGRQEMFEDTVFQFRNSAQAIYSSIAGKLDIDAVDEVEITASIIDLNGLSITSNGYINSPTSATFTTVDTGQGANEVYPFGTASNTLEQSTNTIKQLSLTFEVFIDTATTAYLGSIHMVTKGFKYAITCSSVTFEVDGGSVTGVDCGWISDGGVFGATTDILTGTINVGTGSKFGASGFADATIPANSVFVITSTGTLGAPTQMWGQFTYTIDR